MPVRWKTSKILRYSVASWDTASLNFAIMMIWWYSLLCIPNQQSHNNSSPVTQRQHGQRSTTKLVTTDPLFCFNFKAWFQILPFQCSLLKCDICDMLVSTFPPMSACCVTCIPSASTTDTAVSLLLSPYVWDTVQQMHMSSLPSFFCSACHVEKLITIWVNDSWGSSARRAHMEPITLLRFICWR